MRTYSKREEFARDIVTLLRFCHAKGYGVTFGETWRTEIQQAIYVFAGYSRVDVSQHQKRLAEDLNIWDEVTGKYLISDEQWLEVGEFWEKLNVLNRWGGRFGLDHTEYTTKIGWDRCHFERRDK